MLVWLIERWVQQTGTATAQGDLLAQILLFFTKAGAFVFGSGLAIVPFLQQGVVQHFGWLNDHQFLDEVAVAMITPGPVVIMVAFIGFLVVGIAGAVAASIAFFCVQRLVFDQVSPPPNLPCWKARQYHRVCFKGVVS
jgi:chromate transporter